MAFSLASGVLVSTVLTLVVIPLGCIKASQSLIEVAAAGMPEGETMPVIDEHPSVAMARKEPKSSMPFLLVVWGKLIGAILFIFYLFRGIWLLISQLFARKKSGVDQTRVNETDNQGGGNQTPPVSESGAAPGSNGGVTSGNDDKGSSSTQAAPVEKKPAKRATRTKKSVSKRKPAARTSAKTKSTASQKKAVAGDNPAKKPGNRTQGKLSASAKKSEQIKTGKLQASSKPDKDGLVPDKNEGFGTAVRKRPSNRRGIKLKSMTEMNGPSSLN